MSSKARNKAEEQAVAHIRNHQEADAALVIESLLQGDTKALSQAITWTESTNDKHQQIAANIMSGCLPHSGNSVRIGITGVPGVGKSTFIDLFGDYLISLGKRVAVLAVDPSSRISGGSILGDKTRMELLAHQPGAFVRPTPSSNMMGGVAGRTREAMLLCEAAGFNIILIETVGVGQSETAVHGMTDFFLLLMLAGAGDQLQGIKRGIMEMCDGMLITKADGDNKQRASKACAEYMGALHLFPPSESGWVPRVLATSSVEKTGITSVWEMIEEHQRWMVERNLRDARRNAQQLEWLKSAVEYELHKQFFSEPQNQQRLQKASEMVTEKKMTPYEASLWITKG